MEDLDLDIAASRTDNDLTKELTDHIYAELVMLEAKCIDFDEKQTIAAQEKDRDPSKHRRLIPEQWQALIALHKTLLHEHHDFFLASQHPSASSALRRLATKYSMPARMWRHGIHAFLEVLRHRLPDSLDHMLAFIYIAYSMMALLYEAVPTFEDTWIECLGDLGRYRTALEEDGIRDYEIWPELLMAASRNQRVSWHRPHTTSGDTWAPYASNHKTSAATPPLYVKKVLPITINGIMVQGRHDTGAEGNFISKDDASRLGLRVRENASECQPFSMANGKLVHSIGKARAWVTFANEPETRIKCWFNVLPKLTASPIMGSKFIKVTQTLSKYKHRLQACKPITGILPSVNLIGSITLAKSRFFCLVDGRPTYVNADSASDLDLMSSAYVRAHRYRLDRRLQVCKYIQLADGTITQTIGQVTAVVKLKDGHGHKRTFDVLPGLTSSVLFGDEFLEQIDAFGSYEDSFEDILVGHRHRELSVLTSLGSVNGYLRRHSPWTTQSSVLSDTASTEAKRLDDQDWREMLRQDREAARISRELTGQARALAGEAEARRIVVYKQRRAEIRAGHTSAPSEAGPPVIPMRSPHRPPAASHSGTSLQLQRYESQQRKDGRNALAYGAPGPFRRSSGMTYPPESYRTPGSGTRNAV